MSRFVASQMKSAFLNVCFGYDIEEVMARELHVLKCLVAEMDDDGKVKFGG